MGSIEGKMNQKAYKTKKKISTQKSNNILHRQPKKKML
jgi:hypothetical protein